ncbi:MAG: hypothetical protein JSS66_13080 [Armatimonadetes bacterium]|nr:hypothetical protein [Armatimonadota bacterium]
MLYRWLIGIYGVINILGGVMAFVMPNVKSIWSLVVGGTAGALLLVFAAIAGSKPGFAFRAAAALALALAAFWVYRITEVTAQGKSPMMAVGNLALAVVVFATLGLGHMLAKKKTEA